ncbi:MAG: hypothetical protein IPJ19_09305 [Planctomycetes bacterium]|nr:hypothetical protein [Planctomycetota bacterium]
MGSLLFSIGGLLAGVGGVFFLYGPKLLPAQAQVFEHASAQGLTPGVLWAVSALMFSISILARSLGRNLESLAQSDDHGLIFDQFVTDLAQTRTSMQELRVEFVYLKDHLANLGRDLPTQIAAANESTTRDAMYRLAASLDQVGARLEQRMRSQQGALEGTLQEMQQSLQSTCEQVTQLQDSLLQGVPASGGWDLPAAEPQAPAMGLGVLDHLADGASPLPQDSSIFDGALPTGQQTYEEKLEQLSQLLADPRVRAAADGMARSRGI